MHWSTLPPVIKRFAKLFLRRKRYSRKNGNNIDGSTALFWKTKIRIQGSHNKISAGKDTLFKGCKIWIEGSNCTIEIGERTTLVGTELHIIGNDGKIIIGDHCVLFGSDVLNAFESRQIRIGNDCLISTDVQMLTSDSHPIYEEGGTRINPPADIFLGNRVWICRRSALLKGAAIPDGSVVGFGSVVTKAFDCPNAVFVGQPARLITTGVIWKR